MFSRCWQWGLCSNSFTRDPPQGTAGPLSHVWGALMKTCGKAQKNTRGGGTKERRRGGRGGEDALPWTGYCQRDSSPWRTHTTAKETKTRVAEKLIHLASSPLNHILLHWRDPVHPVVLIKQWRKASGMKLRLGKEEDSPKRFNVYLFCYPVIQYLCSSSIN